MDGRVWTGNVFIERLWRSLPQDVYLKRYADGRKARLGTGAWIAFYNSQRFHQALGYAITMRVWRDDVVDAVAAQAVDMMDNARALPTCHSRNTSSRQHLLLHDIRRSEQPVSD